MTPPPTVLVVDDASTNRVLIEACLRGEGVRVVQAADGNAGLAAARAERPDLLILDLMMPGMDGDELLRRLRAEPDGARPRVLLMTALSEDESRARARELGADDWLAKPFAPRVLRERVRGLLARTGALTADGTGLH